MVSEYIKQNTAVNEQGNHILVTPDGKREQYRITECPSGGYFVELALIPGRLYDPRAYALTQADLNLSDIPSEIWDKRDEYAADQNAAWKVLSDAGVDIAAPLANLQGNPNRELRMAVATLQSLGYLLVWPEEAAEQLINNHVEQWKVMANGGYEPSPNVNPAPENNISGVADMPEEESKTAVAES